MDDLRSVLVETLLEDDKVGAGDIGLVLTLATLYLDMYIRYRNNNIETLLPWPILGSLPRPGIRIKVLQVGDVLLLALGAGTRHGGAEEQVDDQHDNKEDTEGDAEIEKPNWTPATILTWSWFLHWSWPRLDHKDRVGGHQSSVIFFWILNSGICFGL